MAGPEDAVVEDPVWGYRRLDPIPKSDELSRFYESHYCDLLHRGGRAPDLARLTAGGVEATREIEWLRATLYADILAITGSGPAKARSLDIGCGTGEFVAFLAERRGPATGGEHRAWGATPSPRRRPGPAPPSKRSNACSPLCLKKSSTSRAILPRSRVT